MNDKLRNQEKLIDRAVAEEKHKKFKSKDPFPDILPALLNSADIHDYALATGLICPYDPERLKPASYEVKFYETDIIYWDKNDKKIHTFINKDAEFCLAKNFIIYVHLKTKIQLPDYMALRFNLRINLVHKGLLLGTGPLVDPGFVGHLLIPVHNLTATDYCIKGAEGFIWIEFTKISNNTRWNKTSQLQRKGKYVLFPETKLNQSSENYLEAANNNNPIQSSIPIEVQTAQENAIQSKAIALNTKAQLDKITSKIRRYSFVATLGVMFGLVSVIWPIYSLVNDSISYVNNTKDSIKTELQELQALKKELHAILDAKKESKGKTNNKNDKKAKQQ